jgi:hypothetical protein
MQNAYRESIKNTKVIGEELQAQQSRTLVVCAIINTALSKFRPNYFGLNFDFKCIFIFIPKRRDSPFNVNYF